MLAFRLNTRSNIPPYVQLVEQVRQALMTGVLREGDRLPTVREVVESLAINPNTVLKAYRELERDGLVEGRQGIGTFVLRRPDGPPPGTHALLARGHATWVAKAPSAGLRAAGREGPARRAARRGHREHGAIDAVGGRRGVGMTAAIETRGLGRRFGSTWALRDCTVAVPTGRVCGLVGANGAGKTTLLRMLAGLSRPTAGEARVCGRRPADTAEYLSDIGFLAQEIPLHRRWTAEDHLRFGKATNPRWDNATARDRLRSLGIPLDQQIRTLSGGQRAQVALALCLGKRPRVLMLDEPVAALDPLARREFLATLGAAVADGDLTVILSSHLVADLERICDHVVVLSASRTMLAADIEDVLATHRLLSAPRRDTRALERDHVVLHRETTARQTSVWVRLNGPLHDPSWQADELTLEDIVLAYLGSGRPTADVQSLGTVAS